MHSEAQKNLTENIKADLGPSLFHPSGRFLAGAAHAGLAVGASIVLAGGLVEGDAADPPQQILPPGLYKESIINLLK